ncbi:hypothetical protein SynBIOSE41_00922 [Synechococcus sp. BIOS-E4-1]|nr:hypothetical protein SynBIOSE41_00922 [Synechococcus sp. BIOS-E4-1]
MNTDANPMPFELIELNGAMNHRLHESLADLQFLVPAGTSFDS